MQRSKPPFRADHVGSLLRPAPLKEARAKRERGEITDAQLKEVEDREIVKAIRKQGRVVVVGMARMQIPLETMDVIHKQAEIRGSSGGTKEDVAAIYALLASGDVAPVVRHIGFEEIPAGLDDLQHHRVAGRTVAVIDTP